MGIGKRLRQARERAGLTQEELGKRIGVTGSAITNYEKETSHPRETVLYALMDALKVEPNFLFQDCVRVLKRDPEKVAPSGEDERQLLKKYRQLDEHGREMVDVTLDLEYRRIQKAREERRRIQNAIRHYTLRIARPEEEQRRYPVPFYENAASAGFGQWADTAYASEVVLVKKPPLGVSYIIPIIGNSMEPTYHDGDRIFVHVQPEIRPGEIGIFYMDGKEYVKELGEGELISHNPEYAPIVLTEDIRCQGLVLGICDQSYFARS